ncbi:integrase [Streptomyces daqingensis]|uniref:Integrase n=1 Tax=Streptomyces daqingensis TaxID=1472640 RepID=A0ABQ2LRK5_9ACTN|nr:recombinase family protein [Streptomyces daqingensis]GGO42325.1 integrase [Streptomyces daqingensis]
MVDMTSASLYIRLSRQASDSNLSLAGMTKDVQDHCQRLGFTEAALHVDDGLSGGYRDRPEFLAWLDDAKTGRAQVLMTYSVDRLTREGLNVAATLLDVVEGKDPASGRPSHAPVRLLDTQGIDSDHGDAFRFRFVIQAEVARSERERMKQRSGGMRRRARQAGRWAGGLPPFGYQVADADDGAGKVLTIEPDEAAAVREAAERVLRGESLGRVCRWLEHAGHAPRKASTWSRQALRGVLTGTAVLGQISHQGKPVRDADGQILTPFPAILTEAEHAALRALLLAAEPRSQGKGGRPSRLLSGLLTCASCGHPLRVGVTGAGAARYACTSRSDGSQCERPASTTAAGVEEHVTSLYLRVAGDWPMFKERVIVGNASDLAAAERDIRDATADLAQAPTAEAFERLKAAHARRQELADEDPGVRSELVPTGQTGAEWWAAAALEDQREQLSEVFAVLALGPGKRGARGFDPGRLTVVWSGNEG